MSVDTNLNQVTNTLLYSYDDQFNKLYDIQNSLDGTITNKDTILNIENSSIRQKDVYIKVLIDGIIFSLFLMLLVYLYATRLINIKLLIMGVVIYIILYALYYKFIYIKYLYPDANANKMSQNMLSLINNDIKTALSKIVPEPSICAEEESGMPSYSPVGSKNTNILKINDPENVWQYGSIPEAGFTTAKYHKNLYNSPYNNLPVDRLTPQQLLESKPQPWFDAIPSEDVTYYQCKWNGPVTDPVNSSQYQNFVTTVPCSYFPNFKEVNKYIGN
jgi:hypothetical protein